MDPSEYYTYEDRAYIEPTLSRDEQLGFVNTLRDTIDKNTAQINTQTQKLGTDITPNYGGLTGSNSYFKQRYQTTPVQAQMATLKATAQAKALNDLMSNYQNQAANKYQQAYRSAAAKAAAAKTAAMNGEYGGEDPEEYDARRDLTVPIAEDSVGTWVKNADGYTIHKDFNGNILYTDDPAYSKDSSGYYTQKNSIKNQAKNVAWNTFLSGAPEVLNLTAMLPGILPLALGQSIANSVKAGANSIPEAYRK